MMEPTAAPVRRKQTKETRQELFYDEDNTATLEVAGSYYGTTSTLRLSRLVITWTETHAGDSRRERSDVKAYGRAILSDGTASLTERVIRDQFWTDELRSEAVRQTERHRPRG